MQEHENRDRRWLRFHAITAPIGVAAVTAVLAWLGQSSDESIPATVRYLDSAASKTYLATVTYALIAVTVEGVGRMVFWAWSEHKNAQERFKNQGRAEATMEYEKKLAIAAKEHEDELAIATKEHKDKLAMSAKEHEDKLAIAAKEHEAKLAAARERAKAEGIDLDRFLNP